MRWIAAIFAILTPLLNIGTATAPVPRDVKPPPFFPTQVGTKWVFKAPGGAKTSIVITEVTKKDGVTSITICSEGDDGLTLDEKLMVSEKGLYWAQLTKLEFDKPLCLLKFPLKSGENWVSNTTILHGLNVELKCKVLEAEMVEVPAGKFKAFPVVMQFAITDLENKNPETLEWTRWYVQGIGLIKLKGKRSKNEFVTSLESFTPGKE